MKRMAPYYRTLLLFLLIFSGGMGMYGQDSTEVWPGDANANGSVNNVDLLYWGLRSGDTGPPRSTVSIQWAQFMAEKWLTPIPGRPDPAHADCNGDGTVNVLDIQAIEQNYGLDNQSNLPDSSSVSTLATDPLLGFDLSSRPLIAGQMDTIPLTFGTSAAPIDSLLGFSATLTFDSNLVDTAWVWFGDSWLGTPGQDLQEFARFTPGELAIAATRTDQTDRKLGYGSIGGVVVVMDDNLKRNVEVGELRLGFSQALCLTSARTVVKLRLDSAASTVVAPGPEPELTVYPVPVHGGQNLNIELLINEPGPFSGNLLDGMGRLVKSFSFSAPQHQISTQGLIGGIYFLTINTSQGILQRRIIILN